MSPTDEALWKLTWPAAKDALRKIKETSESDKKIESFSNFPALKSVEEGNFIQLDTVYSKPNFKKVFGWGGKWRSSPHTYEEIVNCEALIDFVTENPEYRVFHGWDGDPDDKLGRDMVSYGAIDLIIEIATRHAHVRGFAWDQDYAFSCYKELARWWKGGDLPVRIFVPILNVSFSEDEIHLTQDVKIQRISQQEHQERLFSLPPYKRDSWLMRACTHALIIEQGANITWPRSLGGEQWSTAPYETIDKAIQAISVVTLIPTGYHQVCYEPIGWAPGYTASLGLLKHGFTTKRHSRKLDTATETPGITLNSTECDKVARHFVELNESNPQVSLAASRLQLATLRDDELDEIVDLCVGIEALLGGTKAGDTTYKIAIRGAAILARSEWKDSARAADLIKKVYAYRSLIVHGQVKHEKKRLVRLQDSEFLATNVAHYILKELLEIILSAPSLMSKIDNDQVVFELIDEWVEGKSDCDES